MPEWYQKIRISLLLLQSALGTLVFSKALRKKQRFGMRIAVSLAVGAVFLYFIQMRIPWRTEYTVAYLLLQTLRPLLCYLCLIGVVWHCYDEPGWTVLLVASSGYIAQDLCGSLKSLLKSSPEILLLAKSTVGVLALDLLCYGGGFLLLAILFRPYLQRRDLLDDKFKAIFSFVVLLFCIGMARITQDNPERNEISILSESFYQIICDVFLLLLQFGVMEQRQMHQNVTAMKELLHEQHVQYEAGKENRQLVNEKYHDLKQLLQGFRGQVPTAQLQKLEKQIRGYEANIRTGNDVLDVILSDKWMLCNQREIELTCYVGGADLGFIEELDLYSLFGNILNNAIEAVSQLPPGVKRFVTLTARREGNMALIHSENPCSGTVEFRNGLPQSRRDPQYHGFGMRSMERVAEKYSGSLIAKQEADIFYLDVILLEE